MIDAVELQNDIANADATGRLVEIASEGEHMRRAAQDERCTVIIWPATTGFSPRKGGL